MVGRPVGVVTVEVVVLVPAPVLRRAVEGCEGAVVVAVVTGRVRVEVTGRGSLVVVMFVGRIRVDVTGRVWVAVVRGWVSVPATDGRGNAFKASSTLTG